MNPLTLKRVTPKLSGEAHPNYRHGMGSRTARNPLYIKWSGMKRRCFNKNEKAYGRYGGSGVTMSEEWMDFKNFHGDMHKTWFVGASIDRVDNSKGYSKENCRWVTMAAQSRNRRNVLKYTYQGRTLTIPEWAEELNMKQKTLYARLKVYGWTIEKAVTASVDLGNKYKLNKTQYGTVKK